MTFGEAVYHSRRGKKLSQMDVATALGLSRPTVAGWETGRYEPMLSVAIKAANALDIDLSALEPNYELTRRAEPIKSTNVLRKKAKALKLKRQHEELVKEIRKEEGK